MAARHLSSRLLAQLGRARALAGGPTGALPAAAVQQLAWLSSSAAGSPGDASELAKQLRTAQFQDWLDSLRQTKSALPHAHLLQLAQDQAGLTSEAAQDAISRLERSGQLLSLAGTVVLRPGEVAHALQLLLPGSPADTEARLGEVQRELAALDAQQAAIASRGAWRSRAFVWAGLTSQLALWGLLFRLTYYELSWDVMEPICFFTSGFQALLCYSYFMVHRREFAWDSALDRYVGRWEARALRRAGFDGQRYAHLQREARRLAELLDAQRQREEDEAAAAAAAAEAGATAVAEAAAAGDAAKKEA